MAETSPAEKQTFVYSYRAERKDAFAWQAFRTTEFSDGTFTTEAFYKPDLIEIVMKKITEALKDEGQAGFLAAKKLQMVK